MSDEGLHPGKRYRFVVEGYVYQVGGDYVNVCDDTPITTASDGTPRFGPNGARFTIPNNMLAEEPVKIADHAPGTLFEYQHAAGEVAILVYDPTYPETPWKVQGSQRRLRDGNVDRRYLSRIYRQHERSDR